MAESEDRVELGRLNGAWGTAGWVKVFSLTSPPENIFEYQPWRISDSPGRLHVRQWRRQGPRLVAQLEKIDSREQAEMLHGRVLFVERAEMPRVTDDEFYWHDLVGLNVHNRQEHRLGQVRGLLDAGAHDVLDIRRDDGSTLLVPFVVGHFIDEVDLSAGWIRVDWPLEWIDAD